MKPAMLLLFIVSCSWAQMAGTADTWPAGTIEFTGRMTLPATTTGPTRIIAPNNEPSYFAIALTNYNQHTIPGMAVGINATKETFVVISYQQSIHKQEPALIGSEVWRHFAQNGRWGLWGGAGLSESTNPNTSTEMQNSPSTNNITFLGALSFKITKHRGWFLAGGVRALIGTGNGQRISGDKFGGLGIEF